MMSWFCMEWKYTDMIWTLTVSKGSWCGKHWHFVNLLSKTTTVYSAMVVAYITVGDSHAISSYIDAVKIQSKEHQHVTRNPTVVCPYIWTVEAVVITVTGSLCVQVGLQCNLSRDNDNRWLRQWRWIFYLCEDEAILEIIFIHLWIMAAGLN